MKIETKTKSGTPVLVSVDSYDIKFEFIHPRTKKKITTWGRGWDGNGVICREGSIAIPQADWDRAKSEHEKLSSARKEKEKKEEKERMEKNWKQAREKCPAGHLPVKIKAGICGYLDQWEFESGEAFDPNYKRAWNGGESFTTEEKIEFFFCEESFLVDARKKESERQQRIKENEDRRRKEEAPSSSFEDVSAKAKEAKEDVLWHSFPSSCDGSAEECSQDIINVYVTPEGAKKQVRVHCH